MGRNWTSSEEREGRVTIIPPSFRLSIKVSMRTLRRGCITIASLLRAKYKTQHQLGSIGLVGRNTTKYTNVKNTTCCLDIFGWAVTNGRTALQNVEK